MSTTKRMFQLEGPSQMSGETAKFPKSLLKLQLHAGMVGEDGGEEINKSK